MKLAWYAEKMRIFDLDKVREVVNDKIKGIDKYIQNLHMSVFLHPISFRVNPPPKFES